MRLLFYFTSALLVSMPVSVAAQGTCPLEWPTGDHDANSFVISVTDTAPPTFAAGLLIEFRAPTPGAIDCNRAAGSGSPRFTNTATDPRRVINTTGSAMHAGFCTDIAAPTPTAPRYGTIFSFDDGGRACNGTVYGAAATPASRSHGSGRSRAAAMLTA